MRAFIERIDLYPEKQKDGNWIRNMVFNFPVWCCTIKVDTGNSKSQYIEEEKQEARRDGSESTKIQHGI